MSDVDDLRGTPSGAAIAAAYGLIINRPHEYGTCPHVVSALVIVPPDEVNGWMCAASRYLAKLTKYRPVADNAVLVTCAARGATLADLTREGSRNRAPGRLALAVRDGVLSEWDVLDAEVVVICGDDPETHIGNCTLRGDDWKTDPLVLERIRDGVLTS